MPEKMPPGPGTPESEEIEPPREETKQEFMRLIKGLAKETTLDEGVMFRIGRYWLKNGEIIQLVQIEAEKKISSLIAGRITITTLLDAKRAKERTFSLFNDGRVEESFTVHVYRKRKEGKDWNLAEETTRRIREMRTQVKAERELGVSQTSERALRGANELLRQVEREQKEKS